jgi:hypothetical protein
MSGLVTDGTESSASILNNQFIALQQQGQSALNNLNNISLEALIEVQRGLMRLNGYRCRANRALTPGLAAAFHVSDFQDINQTNTTATVRADAQSVTLAERKQPGNVVVASTTFSSNTGTVEQFGDLYTVTSPSITPQGTFLITLTESESISFLIVDIAPTPSTPNISISVSADNLVYNQALGSSYSGYRINVWVSPQEVKYIQIVFSPTHPDTLNGSTYTFGITDFNALATQYQLASDWYSQPITFNPSSANVMFLAPTVTGLVYYLSFDGEVWQEVNPGQIIPIPGATAVDTTVSLPLTFGGEPNTSGQLDINIPNNTYPSTIEVSYQGKQLPVVPGLPLDSRSTTNSYISMLSGYNGYNLYLLPCTSYSFGELFNVSYIYGPASISAYLRVRLTTTDKAVTPAFTGASLESV